MKNTLGDLNNLGTNRDEKGTNMATNHRKGGLAMKVRTCGSCFRYIEDWRDARAKGLDERHNRHGDYSRKPREGVKPRCMCGKVEEGMHEKHAPCEYHQFRWTWNFEIWWKWKLSNWYRVNVRVPIGNKRKPVPLKYTDYFDGMRDRKKY